MLLNEVDELYNYSKDSRGAKSNFKIVTACSYTGCGVISFEPQKHSYSLYLIGLLHLQGFCNWAPFFMNFEAFEATKAYLNELAHVCE